MSDTLTSLSALAAEANKNHKLAESTAGRALEFARKSGESLTEAKAQVKHGEWIPWLKINFTGPRSTAHKYMTLAANVHSYGHLEPKSISEAFRLIAGESEEDEPEEEEAPPVVVVPVAEKPVARSVPVEVVEDEEEDEPEPEEEEVGGVPQTTPEHGVAIVYARSALNALNKIPKRDPSRKEAIAMIANWLEANR